MSLRSDIFCYCRMVLLFGVFSFYIASCSDPAGRLADRSVAACFAGKDLVPFASFLKISEKGACYIVEILLSTDQSIAPYCVLLCPEENDVVSNDIPVIRVPVSSLALTNTTQAGLLDFAGGIQSVTAVQQGSYFFNAHIQAGLQNGDIADIHAGENLDLELLLSLHPGLLLYNTFSGSRELEKIQRLGIPVLPMSEHLEHHPLGRAAWSVLMGILAGTEEVTIEKFQKVADDYQAMVAKSETENGPNVLTNMGFRGVWYLPGHENYLVRLIRDAGGNYLWNDLQGTNSTGMDLEQVLARAVNADVWINTGRICNRNEILAADPRYQNIKAFQENRVFAATARIANNGQAFDFYESAVARPDLVLKDLINIFHFSESQPLYYYEACR